MRNANQGPQLPDLTNARVSKKLQREQIDLIQSLNRQKLEREVHHPKSKV